MRLLLTGANGMLGQELARIFGTAGYEVRGLDRDRIDFADRGQLTKLLDEFKPNLFINASAYNAVDKIEESEAEFERAMAINARAVGQAAALLQERGIPLVHYSSDYVFAGDSAAGYGEDAPLRPINKYGETKLAGETELKNNTDAYFLIRLSKLFGPSAASEGAKKSFVDTMLWLAREGGKTKLDIVDEEVSAPTYAPDLARFTLELVSAALPYGIYHGANSGTATWYEWAKKIFSLAGISIELNPVSGDAFPRPARRPMFSELKNTKRPPQRSWEEALEEYLSR